MAAGFLLSVLSSVFSLHPVVAQQSAPIKGDYVEARTASVYAGPCHYSGEVMSTGRDAVMAWNIKSGSLNGVDLAGVRVIAVVTSDQNLEDNVNHKSEIAIDAGATQAQADAVVAALESQYGKSLGEVTAVRRVAITFQHSSADYHVTAAGFARLDVQPMPNDECCKQPSLVWYSPLANVTAPKVGYTQTASYLSNTLADPWQRHDENSSFYGAFQF